MKTGKSESEIDALESAVLFTRGHTRSFPTVSDCSKHLQGLQSIAALFSTEEKIGEPHVLTAAKIGVKKY